MVSSNCEGPSLKRLPDADEEREGQTSRLDTLKAKKTDERARRRSLPMAPTVILEMRSRALPTPLRSRPSIHYTAASPVRYSAVDLLRGDSIGPMAKMTTNSKLRVEAIFEANPPHLRDLHQTRERGKAAHQFDRGMSGLQVY